MLKARLWLKLVTVASILSLFCMSLPASALSGSSFQAGRIIDDGVFFNPNTISAPQIQAFLNSKVPTCDTNGTQPISPGSSQTRAQWAAANNDPQPPYTCLKNFSQAVPAMKSDSYCTGSVSAGTKTAAQIIKDVATACNINPEVLIVLLQKEEALVTDDWPWPIEYQEATGYGCPDTSSCDQTYAGFFNQLYYAARQYQKYAKQPDSFNFKGGVTRNIQYSPNASCGSSPVFLQNQATAGLYNYTPYQPNHAALNNLYGTGDSCSAYGNRNFWRMFIDWFGSPYSNCIYPSGPDGTVYRVFNPNTNGVLLSSDPNEICSTTGTMGYIYDSPMFYTSGAGSDPVYRLQKNGVYLFTASTTERDSAINTYGYKLEGVAFTASATYDSSNAPLPVYRLSYPPTGQYYYTISSTESNNLVQNMGFKLNGIAFYTQNTTGNSYPNDIYRLSGPSGGYLYTASSDEATNAVNSYGFTMEGTAFQTRVGYSVDSLPIYRLAMPKGYFYTNSLGERKAAINLGYRPEGVAFFGYQTDNLGASTPIYRLVAKDGTYLYTSSSNEASSAVNNFGYKLEGVAFRVP